MNFNFDFILLFASTTPILMTLLYLLIGQIILQLHLRKHLPEAKISGWLIGADVVLALLMLWALIRGISLS